MKLIDSIAYFSRCLASLIDFPTNWILITMWLSMDVVLVSSVSIIFDYHVSLNLANILYNFCVSQWSSSIVFHTFQSISHHWFFPYELDSHYLLVVHGCSNCFVSFRYFRLLCVQNRANILYNLCVSQWGSSILLHTFQSISHHWLTFLQIEVSLPCRCPWMQYLSCQCPLFSIIMCP